MKRLLVVALGLLITFPTGTAAADTDGFAYLMATEGIDHVNPTFTEERDAALAAGLLVGGVHFALPNRSTGAAQATYFADHGGDWTADGTTLPGALDLESNPYGSACYSMTPAAIVNWLTDFTHAYGLRTDRALVIYTPASWWSQCTANSTAFGRTNPLWLTGSTFPAGWTTFTFRQTATGDVFNGTPAELRAYALAD